MSIGDNIRKLREARGMTQVQLADKIGVSNKAVSSWEQTEDPKIPRMGTIEKIASLFGVQKSDIIDGNIGELDPLPYGILRIKTKRIPLLGTIAAGVPVYAPEDYDACVLADNGLHADFALRVQGDSMMPKFQDSDIVFVRNQPDVYDGQVAAVSVDDEATLKYVYHVPGGLQLTSANPAYAPMLYTEENSDSLRILGLAVGLYRDVR